MKNKDQDERISEEIQYIISDSSPWLLKWGITLIFVILLLMVVLSALVSYPDIIKTQLKITSYDLPEIVSVKEPGTLVRLYVQNDQNVLNGQKLALIVRENHTTILTAPREGKIMYPAILREGEQLLANQKVFYLKSAKIDLFGEMVIPQANVGKVRVGQQVILKVRGYPYQEYGVLTGVIKYIIDTPGNGGEFIAEVDLKSSALTGVRKRIDLNPGMLADAEVVTNSSSLFIKLTGKLFKNFHF